MALLLSAVARGPTSPYEPPPAFALYAADAIALLRGHAGDTPGDIGDATGDGEDTLGRASAEDLQVRPHGVLGTNDGDVEDVVGDTEAPGDRWGR